MVRGGVGGAAADEAPNAQVSVEEAREPPALRRVPGGAVGPGGDGCDGCTVVVVVM